MKKTIFYFAILAIASIFLFGSCQSTNVPVEQNDSYSDETSNSKSASTSNKNKLDLASVFTSDSKYVYGDTSTLFIYSATTSLKQQETVGIYQIADQLYGFGSNYLAAYYKVFYDEYNYKLLEKFYNNYLNDFENKKLRRDDNKTYKEYGKIKVKLNWGTIKKSTPNNGYVDAYIGYKFYKGSPYFTITMYPTFNEFSNYSESATRESLMLNYCFTKAQMQSILDISKPENLMQYFNASTMAPVEDDEY